MGEKYLLEYTYLKKDNGNTKPQTETIVLNTYNEMKELIERGECNLWSFRVNLAARIFILDNCYEFYKC